MATAGDKVIPWPLCREWISGKEPPRVARWALQHPPHPSEQQTQWWSWWGPKYLWPGLVLVTSIWIQWPTWGSCKLILWRHWMYFVMILASHLSPAAVIYRFWFLRCLQVLHVLETSYGVVWPDNVNLFNVLKLLLNQFCILACPFFPLSLILWDHRHEP